MTPRPPRHHRRAGRVGEVLRRLERERLHVHGRTRREQDRDQRRGRDDLRTSRSRGEHAQPQGQAQAQPAHRHRASGPTPSAPSSPSPRATDRALRDGEASHGHSQAQAHQPGPPVPDVSDFAEITTATPEKSLLGRSSSSGGRNIHGRMTSPPPGRRPQAAVPHHRLQAEQGRRAGQGRAHRVRPEPQRRIALLHYLDGEKRYILAPAGREVGDTAAERARARRSGPATRCRCATSRSAPSCTTSS